jgi:hypothetical protein
MLAPKKLPEMYQRWNAAHGAPHGHPIRFGRLRKRWLPDSWLRGQGPFSVQPNNTIRAFEYPWAFDVAKIQADWRDCNSPWRRQAARL